MTLAPDGALAQRFDVRRQLGKGGFAVVYEAVDRTSGEDVALKVLEPDEGTDYDPKTRARFHREVELLVGLRSPHTVRILDHGEADGRLFAVFELVAGEDLSRTLERRGALRPDEAVHVIEQLLHALNEAHRQGLVHRDLKPENIRVFEEAGDPLRVKLLDFGISRPIVGNRLTDTGELVGTPRYMSPEQLSARPITPASDVYSLGLIAFEMLLGRQALHGNKWSDQFDRLRTGHLFSAPQLEHLGPLLTIIQKMTARDPAERFANASEVLRALHRPDRRYLPIAVLGLVLLVGAAIALFATRPNEAPAAQPVVERRASNPLSAAALEIERRSPSVDVGDGSRLESYPHREDAEPSAGCRRNRLGLLGDLAMHCPNRLDPDVPLPLVVLLHTDQNTPAHTLEVSGFRDVANREGFYVVAPGGTAVKGAETLFNAWREDAGSVRTAVETVRENLCVDDSRIFIVATGDGGRRTHELLNEDWLRALALSSFLDNHDARLRILPTAAMWVLPSHSRRLPIDGSMSCGQNRKKSVDEMTDTWKKANGCTGPPVEDDSLGKCQSWTCDAPLKVCLVPGGIGWPGETPGLGCEDPESARLPHAEEIWKFLIAAPPRPPRKR